MGSVTVSPDGHNNTLSQGFILGHGPHCEDGGKNSAGSKDRGGGKEPLRLGASSQVIQWSLPFRDIRQKGSCDCLCPDEERVWRCTDFLRMPSIKVQSEIQDFLNTKLVFLIIVSAKRYV